MIQIRSPAPSAYGHSPFHPRCLEVVVAPLHQRQRLDPLAPQKALAALGFEAQVVAHDLPLSATAPGTRRFTKAWGVWDSTKKC